MARAVPVMDAMSAKPIIREENQMLKTWQIRMQKDRCSTTVLMRITLTVDKI